VVLKYIIKHIAIVRTSNSESAYRSIKINGERVEICNGFSDLHTKSYEAILSGDGFGLMEALPSIELVHNIRSIVPVGIKGDYHPFATLPIIISSIYVDV
jgi:UDP-N-acetyl-2-amino-2-deoxyglucuronate dehydrogenase